MENGHEERLAERFSGLGFEDSSLLPENEFKNDNLFQVIKAVEAAETTIKEQVEENSRLKAELQRSALELAKYKSDESLPQTSNIGDHTNSTTVSRLVHQPVDWKPVVIKASDADSSGLLVVHPHVNANDEEATVSNRFESHSEGNISNGTVKGAIDGTGPSQFDSSISPMRMRLEGEHDAHVSSSTHGSMPVGEVNHSGNAWTQDLIHKVQEQEQEISQLRRYLTDCSVKEAQIRNEKYVLEKRIAYMRLAFDQQQQDLVDASSKALSYRQEIIEENIRLTYALQATQQERSTFVSYLLPLLSEYSLQPQVSDAQSIVSNVKVLFKHLQEKLLLTETKLKESEYQLAPWQSDVNHSNDSPLAPSRSAGVALTHYTKDSMYSHDHTAIDWNLERQQQDEPSSSAVRNYHLDDSSTFSPLENSQSAAFEMHVQPGTSVDEYPAHKKVDETPPKHVQFLEPISKTVVDDAQNPSYGSAFDDPSSSNSPLLSPVFEEPSSSFSEGGDDDPLPAIEDLQISGEPYPGHELQACGYSINGTTSCNFEWVCHLEDGSVNYIDGAKQPNYLVTADDVDLYLAIEVQPLDDRNRKVNIFFV
ncbi:hypothetical protein AXX17_AT5G23080 [Arabidopsis thaliana]|uniref:Uncharacterized protein n=2 Tax=Arabidopsis thaliana TaxID=3702 RepID=A0A178UNQ1_ARATH|nr:hypothetical protein AXX17_AT5G23080 [Arabidopsis thaliana]